MSNKFFSLAVAAAVLALPMRQLFAQGDARIGARTVLLLHNQQEMGGRLLFVGDSALVISKNDAQVDYIDAQTASISMAKNQDFQDASIEDNSSVRKGMLLGFLIGAGTGAIIGLAQGDDPSCSETGPLAPCFRLTAEAKGVIGGILGGGAGLIVGGIVGAATSK